MNTTQGSEMTSSIFIGRRTPKILFSEKGLIRAVAPATGKRCAAHAGQNSPQYRIHGFNRQTCDAIEGHHGPVFVDQTGKDNQRSTQRHVPLAKRYRKDVSAEVRLWEAETR